MVSRNKKEDDNFADEIEFVTSGEGCDSGSDELQAFLDKSPPETF